MTAAGIATLFITQEFMPAAGGLDCEGNLTIEYIERGLKWMNANFHTVQNNNYLWYCIERIGAASGRKYFGGKDWYAVGRRTSVRAAEEGRVVDDQLPRRRPDLRHRVRAAVPVARAGAGAGE